MQFIILLSSALTLNAFPYDQYLPPKAEKEIPDGNLNTAGDDLEPLPSKLHNVLAVGTIEKGPNDFGPPFWWDTLANPFIKMGCIEGTPGCVEILPYNRPPFLDTVTVYKQTAHGSSVGRPASRYPGSERHHPESHHNIDKSYGSVSQHDLGAPQHNENPSEVSGSQFQQPVISSFHPGLSQGASLDSSDPEGHGSLSSPLGVDIRNTIGDMGRCPAGHACIDFQLCTKEAYIIFDGSGIINKQITEVPSYIKNNVDHCGGSMYCCKIPIQGSLLLDNLLVASGQRQTPLRGSTGDLPSDDSLHLQQDLPGVVVSQVTLSDHQSSFPISSVSHKSEGDESPVNVSPEHQKNSDHIDPYRNTKDPHPSIGANPTVDLHSLPSPSLATPQHTNEKSPPKHPESTFSHSVSSHTPGSSTAFRPETVGTHPKKDSHFSHASISFPSDKRVPSSHTSSKYPTKTYESGHGAQQFAPLDEPSQPSGISNIPIGDSNYETENEKYTGSIIPVEEVPLGAPHVIIEEVVHEIIPDEGLFSLDEAPEIVVVIPEPFGPKYEDPAPGTGPLVEIDELTLGLLDPSGESKPEQYEKDPINNPPIFDSIPHSNEHHLSGAGVPEKSRPGILVQDGIPAEPSLPKYEEPTPGTGLLTEIDGSISEIIDPLTAFEPGQYEDPPFIASVPNPNKHHLSGPGAQNANPVVLVQEVIQPGIIIEDIPIREDSHVQDTGSIVIEQQSISFPNQGLVPYENESPLLVPVSNVDLSGSQPSRFHQASPQIHSNDGFISSGPTYEKDPAHNLGNTGSTNTHHTASQKQPDSDVVNENEKGILSHSFSQGESGKPLHSPLNLPGQVVGPNYVSGSSSQDKTSDSSAQPIDSQQGLSLGQSYESESSPSLHNTQGDQYPKPNEPASFDSSFVKESGSFDPSIGQTNIHGGHIQSSHQFISNTDDYKSETQHAQEIPLQVQVQQHDGSYPSPDLHSNFANQASLGVSLPSPGQFVKDIAVKVEQAPHHISSQNEYTQFDQGSPGSPQISQAHAIPPNRVEILQPGAPGFPDLPFNIEEIDEATLQQLPAAPYTGQDGQLVRLPTGGVALITQGQGANPLPANNAGGMGGMGMMMLTTYLGTPLMGRGCSAGMFCVSDPECDPYRGFIILDPLRVDAVIEGQQKVPRINCRIPLKGKPLNGRCCALPHNRKGD